MIQAYRQARMDRNVMRKTNSVNQLETSVSLAFTFLYIFSVFYSFFSIEKHMGHRNLKKRPISLLLKV